MPMICGLVFNFRAVSLHGFSSNVEASRRFDEIDLSINLNCEWFIPNL